MINWCTTKSLNMASEHIRIVLEIEDQVVTERMVEKKTHLIEEIITRWKHTYAVKSRKKPYKIYVEIPSQMTPRKFKKSKQQYINNYEQVETTSEIN